MSCSSPALIPNARTGNKAPLKANDFANLEVKKDQSKDKKKTKKRQKNPKK